MLVTHDSTKLDSYEVSKPKKDIVDDGTNPNWGMKREFTDRKHLEVVVSDLTYIRVAGKWHYACFIIDLFNREIIGYSSGKNKNAIDGLIDTFNIKPSLSKKGCPYDNAVTEAAFKIFKTEFVYQDIFKSLEELQTGLSDYVNWNNNIQIHSSLGYQTPTQFRETTLKKIV